MDEGFCRPARQKIAGILDVFQNFLTRQGGKRSGQTAFNACEYRFLVLITPKQRLFFRDTLPVFLEIHTGFPGQIGVALGKNISMPGMPPFFEHGLAFLGKYNNTMRSEERFLTPLTAFLPTAHLAARRQAILQPIGALKNFPSGKLHIGAV